MRWIDATDGRSFAVMRVSLAMQLEQRREAQRAQPGSVAASDAAVQWSCDGLRTITGVQGAPYILAVRPMCSARRAEHFSGKSIIPHGG